MMTSPIDKTIAANARRHNQSTCQILIDINEIMKKILASWQRTLQKFEERNNIMMRIILRRRRLTTMIKPRLLDTSKTDKNNPPFLRQEEVTPVPTMATQLQLQPKRTDDTMTATIAANARRHNQLRPKPIHWMFPPPRTHNRRL